MSVRCWTLNSQLSLFELDCRNHAPQLEVIARVVPKRSPRCELTTVPTDDSYALPAGAPLGPSSSRKAVTNIRALAGSVATAVCKSAGFASWWGAQRRVCPRGRDVVASREQAAQPTGPTGRSSHKAGYNRILGAPHSCKDSGSEHLTAATVQHVSS